MQEKKVEKRVKMANSAMSSTLSIFGKLDHVALFTIGSSSNLDMFFYTSGS